MKKNLSAENRQWGKGDRTPQKDGRCLNASSSAEERRQDTSGEICLNASSSAADISMGEVCTALMLPPGHHQDGEAWSWRTQRCPQQHSAEVGKSRAHALHRGAGADPEAQPLHLERGAVSSAAWSNYSLLGNILQVRGKGSRDELCVV